VVSEELRALIRAAPGAGELRGAGVVAARAEHPVCGDEVELFVRLAGDQVEDLAWRARGCPACVAVAAAARDAVVGGRLDQAGARLAQRVAALGGLARAEQHALALLDRALSSLAPPS
jgi:NifU-like protein involved in Fe-S cluster formation